MGLPLWPSLLAPNATIFFPGRGVWCSSLFISHPKVQGGGTVWLRHQVSSLLARERQGPYARWLRWRDEAGGRSWQGRTQVGGPLAAQALPSFPRPCLWEAGLELWTGLDRSQVMGEAGADVCSLPGSADQGSRTQVSSSTPSLAGGVLVPLPGEAQQPPPCHGYPLARPQALSGECPPTPH